MQTNDLCWIKLLEIELFDIEQFVSRNIYAKTGFGIKETYNGWYTISKPNPIFLIYMYKEDLALNNLQWFICYKTQPNQSIYLNIYA